MIITKTLLLVSQSRALAWRNQGVAASRLAGLGTKAVGLQS